MRSVIAFLLSVGLIGAASAREPPAYSGPDAGYVVLAVGTSSNHYSNYRLHLRKNGDTTFDQYFEYIPRDLFVGQSADFSEPDEKGVVISRPLPPGDYEIYNLEVLRTVSRDFWKAKDDFSITFTVKTGETTYLGDFRGMMLGQPRLFGPSGDGAYFIVSDKSARDLPLARSKKDTPAKGNVTNAIPDPAMVNSFFVRSEPLADAVHLPDPSPVTYQRIR